jgi:uncharacterized protein (TIGR01777 family)
MKVLVTGATGFVGRRVVEKLIEKNHEVIVVSRNVQKAFILFGEKVQYFLWSDFESIPDLYEHEIDSVIHLAGENIGEKRWSKKQKKKIHDSRILGTKNLIRAINKCSREIKSFVSTSAIGIYTKNHSSDITEQSELDNDFLGKLCKNWESELSPLKSSVRTVIFRVGVVLGEGGGMLKNLMPIFKVGMGGPIGQGAQEMSWIHIQDLADLYVAAVDTPFKGVFNAVSSNPVSNREFSIVLGAALKKPVVLMTPSFVIRIAMGEMSCIALDSQRIFPSRLMSLGHKFKYDTIEAALKEICAK